jgi:hypothetical protein
MKTLIVLAAAALVTCNTFAGPLADSAKADAQKCADAQITKDYAKVVSFTHPALVKAAGGKEALLKALEAAMKEVAKQGIAFEKTVIPSATEPKKVGNALVSQVTQQVTLRVPDGRLTQESTLLGFSYDEGKNWVFADTVEMDEAAYDKLFPELKGVIPLPKKKEPVLEKKK